MKEITRFRFEVQDKSLSREQREKLVEDFFETYHLEGCPYLQADSSDEITAIAGGMAERFGLRAERYDYVCLYDKGELEQYPYIMLRALYCGPQDYSSKYQTQYTVKSCPVCGKTYETAIPPLYYNKREFRGKNIARTSAGSIVVTAPLKRAIEQEKLSGATFSEAFHYNSRMKQEYTSYMMQVNSVLPLRCEESMPDRHEFYCGHCHGTILFGSHPRYHASDFSEGLDFYLTKEYEGRILHGEQSLILSQKAYQVIKGFLRIPKGAVAGVELLG